MSRTKKLSAGLPVGLGADPEIFFDKDGEIVGSERVLTKNPRSVGAYRVYLDGVQAELKVGEGTICRETFASYMTNAFSSLNNALEGINERRLALPEGVDRARFNVCYRQVVEVSQAELDSLSKEARALGCAPSFNYYGLVKREVDGAVYRVRSAGGHMHFGINSENYQYEIRVACERVYEQRRKLVPLFDILMGIPGVLLDRDPDQVIRRQTYGMAGEYRLPDHGIEYRTLSNFWLRSYQLTSLFLGLGRMAITLLTETFTGKDDFESALLEKADLDKVVKAIQENDANLAWEVYHEVIAPFVNDYVTNNDSYYQLPLKPKNLKKFEAFAARVQRDGLEKVFKKDPMKHWLELRQRGNGWESWIARINPRTGSMSRSLTAEQIVIPVAPEVVATAAAAA